MNILVIGKGGREHTLAWKLNQSPTVERVFCTPGNPGTHTFATNVPIPVNEFDKLVEFAIRENIGLTVVGPEDPLAAGITDVFRAKRLRVFGPTKTAARIEGSKVFAKQLMRFANVPTAEFQVFDRPDHARTYVESRDYPVVVKADGLAAGKGVFVCSDTREALLAIDRIMVYEEFGLPAGRQIVIEKRLEGEELSIFGLVSGRSILLLPPTQDHKPALDGDQGPNTGGMGAYCPAPKGTPELLSRIESEVFVPTIHAMKRGRFPFQGLLYVGLMLTNQGPRVLEYNCRFGDPETQPMLMRFRGDLAQLLLAVAEERLGEVDPTTLEWDSRPSVCVVLASRGYPGKYDTGKVIRGLDDAAALPDVQVFHAGTDFDERRRVVTAGGRVLGVTAQGDTLADAKKRAYEAVDRISFNGMHFRTDIADKALP